MSVAERTVGRTSAELAGSVRSGIVSGDYPVGSFLPSVRALSGEQGISRETARRALKSLEAEGLIVARRGNGYQVLSLANDPRTGCPMAYVTRFSDLDSAEPLVRSLQNEFQRAAGQRGWSTLSVHLGDLSDEEMREQLHAARAWGLALDVLDERTLRLIEELDLPAVMVNAWHERAEFDCVLQDNYRGGYLAARHLIDAGCRSIGWVGPMGLNVHSRQRYAGATAALIESGMKLGVCGEMASLDEASALRGARKVLGSPRRPEGVLCLWADAAAAAKKASDELGIRIERDYRMVAWSIDELWESRHLVTFAGGPIPPAITWKVSSMVETALQRLSERRDNPGLEPLRVSIPARLRFKSGGEK
jgi:DNA-binding LacI/PurR family transcriptional regulator